MNTHLLTGDDRALIRAAQVEKGWGAPPNSPDLHPVDYSTWEALQQFVYHPCRNRDVEHLKEVLKPAESRYIHIYIYLLPWSTLHYRSHYRTVSQTTVTCCCNRCRTHWALLWLMFLVLHVHYHTTLSYLCYVVCCRNTELGQWK